SIAIVPGGELERLPAAAVRRTYDRYWEEIELRKQGLWHGEAYSPYELRNVAGFVRLGGRQRAHALLAHLMTGRPPAPPDPWAGGGGAGPRPAALHRRHAPHLGGGRFRAGRPQHAGLRARGRSGPRGRCGPRPRMGDEPRRRRGAPAADALGYPQLLGA